MEKQVFYYKMRMAQGHNGTGFDMDKTAHKHSFGLLG